MQLHASGLLGAQGGPPEAVPDPDWVDGEEVDLAAALSGGGGSSGFLIPTAAEVEAAGGDRADAGWGGRPSETTAAAAAATAWAAGGSMRVSLASDCLMQVSVASACERYLRVWIEWTPSAAGAAVAPPTNCPTGSSGGGSGSEVVLPPGEAAPLRCQLVPEAATAASGRDCSTAVVDTKCSSSGGAVGVASSGEVAAAPLPEEPDRLVAAEAVCGSWAVAWRMIGLEDEAPHGSVQLSAVDVARVGDEGRGWRRWMKRGWEMRRNMSSMSDIVAVCGGVLGSNCVCVCVDRD